MVFIWNYTLQPGRNRFDRGEVGGFQQLHAVIRGWARPRRPVELAAFIRSCELARRKVKTLAFTDSTDLWTLLGGITGSMRTLFYETVSLVLSTNACAPCVCSGVFLIPESHRSGRGPTIALQRV
jgi:hypothetical protein